MAKISAPLKLLGRGRRPARLDESAILLALASPVLVVDADNQIVYVNDATEQFFRLSANQLVDHRLADFIPADSPLFSLLSQVRAHGNSMSDHGVTLETPRIGTRDVTIEVASIADYEGQVAICIHERSVALQFHQQLTSAVRRATSPRWRQCWHTKLRTRCPAFAALRNCWSAHLTTKTNS